MDACASSGGYAAGCYPAPSSGSSSSSSGGSGGACYINSANLDACGARTWELAGLRWQMQVADEIQAQACEGSDD